MNVFRPSVYARLNVLDISNNPIIDVKEDVFFTYRSLSVKMSNLKDTSFYWDAPQHYSITMLETYFESNTILQLRFKGERFVSFCSLGSALNVMGVIQRVKRDMGPIV